MGSSQNKIKENNTISQVKQNRNNTPSLNLKCMQSSIYLMDIKLIQLTFYINKKQIINIKAVFISQNLILSTASLIKSIKHLHLQQMQSNKAGTIFLKIDNNDKLYTISHLQYPKQYQTTIKNKYNYGIIKLVQMVPYNIISNIYLTPQNAISQINQINKLIINQQYLQYYFNHKLTQKIQINHLKPYFYYRNNMIKNNLNDIQFNKQNLTSQLTTYLLQGQSLSDNTHPTKTHNIYQLLSSQMIKNIEIWQKQFNTNTFKINSHQQKFAYLSSNKQLTAIQKDRRLKQAKNQTNLGIKQKHNKNYQTSRKYHQNSLKIQQQVLGQMNPKIAQEIKCIAYTYYEQRNYIKAIQIYSEAINIYQINNIQDQWYIDALCWMGKAYKERLRHYQNAKICYEKALLVSKLINKQLWISQSVKQLVKCLKLLGDKQLQEITEIYQFYLQQI